MDCRKTLYIALAFASQTSVASAYFDFQTSSFSSNFYIQTPSAAATHSDSLNLNGSFVQSFSPTDIIASAPGSPETGSVSGSGFMALDPSGFGINQYFYGSLNLISQLTLENGSTGSENSVLEFYTKFMTDADLNLHIATTFDVAKSTHAIVELYDSGSLVGTVSTSGMFDVTLQKSHHYSIHGQLTKQQSIENMTGFLANYGDTDRVIFTGSVIVIPEPTTILGLAACVATAIRKRRS